MDWEGAGRKMMQMPKTMPKTTNIAVIGSGAWGTATALVLASKNTLAVSQWVPRAESHKALIRTRENSTYLPGVPLPESIHLHHEDLRPVAEADWWVLATPAVFLERTLATLKARGMDRFPPAISLIKGMDFASGQRPSQVIARLLGHDRIVVVSGPSHAEEVARALPASLVAASAQEALAVEVQQIMGTSRLRIYTSTDIVGVEWAGIHKNVMGIAAGICQGLGLGDNAVSALMTRGLAEMARWGVSQGGEQETYMGLAGVGDLATTCISKHGRNRQVGLRLARGETLAQIQAEMKQVAEGINTVQVLKKAAAAQGIGLPITEAVHAVLFEGIAPAVAVERLLQRTPKPEMEENRSGSRKVS